jgi:hypothetical protein
MVEVYRSIVAVIIAICDDVCDVCDAVEVDGF